jgi:hypothetical protein
MVRVLGQKRRENLNGVLHLNEIDITRWLGKDEGQCLKNLGLNIRGIVSRDLTECLGVLFEILPRVVGPYEPRARRTIGLAKMQCFTRVNAAAAPPGKSRISRRLPG